MFDLIYLIEHLQTRGHLSRISQKSILNDGTNLDQLKLQDI